MCVEKTRYFLTLFRSLRTSSGSKLHYMNHLLSNYKHKSYENTYAHRFILFIFFLLYSTQIFNVCLTMILLYALFVNKKKNEQQQ